MKVLLLLISLLLMPAWLVLAQKKPPVRTPRPRPAKAARAPRPQPAPYEVRTLHNLLTPDGLRCAITCPAACAPTVVCTHDTLERGPRGGPERLVYRSSNAHVARWQLPRYEAALTGRLRHLLRQEYAHDSVTYAPTTPPDPLNRPAPAVSWAQSSLLTAALLITPRRDTLLSLNIERMHGRVEDDVPTDASLQSRAGEATTATDSSYCFLLRGGRLRLVSGRDRYTEPQRRATLEYRLVAACRPWLLAQLPAGAPRRGRLFISRLDFTPAGVFVHYGFIDEEGNLPSTIGGPTATIPYRLLPPEVFTFPTW